MNNVCETVQQCAVELGSLFVLRATTVAPHSSAKKTCDVARWVTHRSSNLASRSATLLSIRKISSSSAEKDRAIVLATAVYCQHAIIANVERRADSRLWAAATGLPVLLKILIGYEINLWSRRSGSARRQRRRGCHCADVDCCSRRSRGAGACTARRGPGFARLSTVKSKSRWRREDAKREQDKKKRRPKKGLRKVCLYCPR